MRCYHGPKSQANLDFRVKKIRKMAAINAQRMEQTTVIPVYNGYVLSDHPLLSASF